MTHVYLSTACLHGQHAECRQQCKFCPALCVCECREAVAEAAAPLIAAQVLRGRAQALRDAYWKLREHASVLRATEVYRKASERKEGTFPAFQQYRWLEATARGIEDGARDIAELLSVTENEIGEPEELLDSIRLALTIAGATSGGTQK